MTKVTRMRGLNLQGSDVSDPNDSGIPDNIYSSYEHYHPCMLTVLATVPPKAFCVPEMNSSNLLRI